MTALARWPLWSRMGLAAFAGGLAAFGFAPFGFWPATLVALPLLPILLLVSGTPWRAALSVLQAPLSAGVQCFERVRQGICLTWNSRLA